MKLKLIIIAAGVAIVGSSVIVLVKQSRQSRLQFAPSENQLPAAISNYSKTFKLNTNPPIWATPANGRNATN
jgi:hypothetical protein